ncbi:MAG: replicative DNA helicase [Acidobacteria bacterium]|nr:replicative DNA helicase [Acidobacteriota bacterium]
MSRAKAEVTSDRSLPSSVETERSILGVVLLDNTTLPQVLEFLHREDFYVDAHRRILDKMIALFEKGQPVDPLTLREELSRSSELDQVGGVRYLGRLIDGVPQLRNLEHYARIVREKSMLRRLILASHQIIGDCFELEEDSAEVMTRAQQSILQIAEDQRTSGFTIVAEVARRQLETIEQLAGRPHTITGLPSGFTEFDQLTSGLQPSDLIIVAARPSAGKTSFALSIAQHAASQGFTTGIYSLEMSKEQLVMRLLCSESRVNMHRYRAGFLNQEEWKRLAAGLHALSQWKIFIDDTPGINPLEVRAKARRLKHERGLDLLVIDYLQLMAARGRVESRTQEVSQISRELKAIAKELNIPVLVVSQLSRAPEMRQEHKPQLSDLRESGQIEQDADVVVFIYREEMYNPTEENSGIAEIIIGKQRNGPTDSLKLAFLKEFTRFENLWRE